MKHTNNPREKTLSKQEIYKKLATTSGSERNTLIGMLQRRSTK